MNEYVVDPSSEVCVVGAEAEAEAEEAEEEEEEEEEEEGEEEEEEEEAGEEGEEKEEEEEEAGAFPQTACRNATSHALFSLFLRLAKKSTITTMRIPKRAPCTVFQPMFARAKLM